MKAEISKTGLTKVLIPLLLLTLLFLTYCEREEPMPSSSQKQVNFISNITVKDSILPWDFLKGKIQSIGDLYLYEGDIILNKAALDQLQTKQAYVTSEQGFLIEDYNKQNSITVAIDASIPTNGEDNWRDAIATAISDWNGVPECRIQMTLVTGTADILISSDNGILDDGHWEYYNGQYYWVWTLAAASWPDGSNPGPTILINLDTDNNRVFSFGQMRYNMVHELGHCIGLRHTNWTSLGEATANQISTTPTSDASSVMNGQTALNSWNGFSGYDERALQIIYSATCYEQLGDAVWYNTNAVTSDNSWVYMVQNSRLYRVSPNDGSYTQLGGVYWSNTTAMTYLNSYIYIARNSRIYKVNPLNGTFTQLGGAYWANVNAMTSYNGWIYLVQNSRFYRVNPTNGSYTQLGGAWWTNTEAMASLGNWIYLVQNSRIYQVDPNNGDYGQIGDIGWSGTDAMTSLNGFLYVVQNSFLHKVDPSDGGYILLGYNVWGGTYGMTSMNNHLYLAQNSRFYSFSFN